jgi:uncharacterized membrane protein YhaH (DUF805 family)
MLGLLFSFRGRMGSRAFLIISLVGAVLIFLMGVGFKHRLQPGFLGLPWRELMIGGLAIMLASLVMVFAIVWSGLAIIVKRLRDIGAPILLGLLAMLVFSGCLQLATRMLGQMSHLSNLLAWDLSQLTASATTVVLSLWPAQRDRASEIAEVFGDAEDELMLGWVRGVKPVQSRAQFGLRRQ